MKLVLENLKGVSEMLGTDLFASICQCCIHADRLMSLGDLAVISEKTYGFDSVQYRRNLSSIFWFSCGTIWETIKAVHDLESNGIEMFVGEDNKWKELKNIVQSWQNEKYLPIIRNTIAFHTDENRKLLNKGIKKLSESSASIDLAYLSEDQKKVNAWLVLGEQVLLTGEQFQEKDIIEFMKNISENQIKFSSLVSDIIGDCLRACNAAISKR
jgi:hypothetical protein